MLPLPLWLPPAQPLQVCLPAIVIKRRKHRAVNGFSRQGGRFGGAGAGGDGHAGAKRLFLANSVYGKPAL